MSTRITDLEKFVLEQVYRPYWTSLVKTGCVRPEKLTKGANLENAVVHLKAYPEWANLVIDRIQRCDFTFAKYLQEHELVKFINTPVKE